MYIFLNYIKNDIGIGVDLPVVDLKVPVNYSRTIKCQTKYFSTSNYTNQE